MSPRAAVLVVGGVDPGGGAGVAMDLAFLTHLGVRAGIVVSALTVQDDDAVTRVAPVDDALFEEQLGAAVRVLSTSIRAVKTGLVVTRRQAEAVAGLARKQAWPLVVDPLLHAGTGERFHASDGVALLGPLVEQAAIVTPNLEEAEVLSGSSWDGTESGLLALATAISDGRRVVAVSHGAAGGERAPLAISGEGVSRIVIAARRQDARTHGTGCALAATIAGLMALGRAAPDAAAEAHALVASCVRRARPGPGGRVSPEPPAAGTGRTDPA